MNAGGGPSQVIVPADIVGINVPGPRRIINLEISGDFPSAAQIAKFQRFVRGSWRFRSVTKNWN